MTTRKMPIEKRLNSRSLAGKDLRISKSAGIGRMMRRMSVKMFKAPRIMS